MIMKQDVQKLCGLNVSNATGTLIVNLKPFVFSSRRLEGFVDPNQAA